MFAMNFNLFRMFWILVGGAFSLSILLVVTIAYLAVYLGYYSPINIQTTEPKFNHALIAYKGIYAYKDVGFFIFI